MIEPIAWWSIHHVDIAPGWWTAEHTLVVLNGVLAAAAVGTMVFAGFTIRSSNNVAEETGKVAKETGELARQTKSLVEHTERQAKATESTVATATQQLEVSRVQLQESIRPWLTIGLPEPTGGIVTFGPVQIRDRDASPDRPEGVYAFVRLLNIGSGLAFIRAGASNIIGWDGQGTEPKEFTHGAIRNPILAPGEEGTIEFVVVKTSAAWSGIDTKAFTNQRIGSMQGTDGQFFTDIVYSDSMNEVATHADFHFAFVKGSGWVTVSVSYFTPPDSTEPQIVASMRGD